MSSFGNFFCSENVWLILFFEVKLERNQGQCLKAEICNLFVYNNEKLNDYVKGEKEYWLKGLCWHCWDEARLFCGRTHWRGDVNDNRAQLRVECPGSGPKRTLTHAFNRICDRVCEWKMPLKSCTFARETGNDDN